MKVRLLLVTALVWLAAAPFRAAEPIRYRFSFPQPEHHWMQVEAVYPDVESTPLELRMSVSSPGRYSLHNFSKNVYDVHAFSSDGRELSTTRPDPYGWTVPAHDSTVTVRYKVFGDFLDGTYLSIDATHAHVNVPAVVLWARGMDDRPSTVVLDEPPGRQWQAATQLHPGGRPLTFTAPNLQYLIDSPIEFSSFSTRQFPAGGATVRIAMHHTGSESDLDSFARDVEKIVRTEGAIFGEFPAFEPGSYTFIIDSLPTAEADGMEHRNSTVIATRSSIQGDRDDLLASVSHEFFHSWNVERIRPRSLEPFNLERVNMSDELWLAEGFTEYYGALSMKRAGVAGLGATLEAFRRYISSVTLSPSRGLRSAVEMSQLAAFSDRDVPEDATNQADTFVSYYNFGGALALALDLDLRNRSAGRLSLDDYMRELWRAHGKPGGTREGYVDRPYTMADLEARLGVVAGDAAFAREFFSRFVQGREPPDFERLLATAGLVLRKRAPGGAWLGTLRFPSRGNSMRLSEAPRANTPAYAAGLDVEDQIEALDGERVQSPSSIQLILQRHHPGDAIEIRFTDRSGVSRQAMLTLAENPEIELVASESAGRTLSPAQDAVRKRWLGP